MRRTLPLLLCLFLAVPSMARGQDDEGEGDDEETKPKKKSRGDSTEQGEMQFEGVELTPKKKKKAADKPDPEKPQTAEKPEEDGKPSTVSQMKDKLLTILEEDKPLTGFARHRYGYIIGAGFLVTGLAFAYSSQGEAKRAETIGTAREASQALENARASAATANVVYGMAIAALAVTILFEIIPESVAQRASLTFHF